jgi:hypothetical protein
MAVMASSEPEPQAAGQAAALLCEETALAQDRARFSCGPAGQTSVAKNLSLDFQSQRRASGRRAMLPVPDVAREQRGVGAARIGDILQVDM